MTVSGSGRCLVASGVWPGSMPATGRAWPVPRPSCSQPAGYVIDNTDCSPADENTYPGAPEICDSLDNQCPGDPGFGLIDEIPVAGFFDPGDNTIYSWPDQPGAVEYQVARSEFPHFSVGCVLVPTGAPFWIDTDPPPLGGVFYYLVRASLPHVGTWGVDSSGMERLFVCP